MRVPDTKFSIKVLSPYATSPVRNLSERKICNHWLKVMSCAAFFWRNVSSASEQDRHQRTDRVKFFHKRQNV